jgi:hypothetical protein
MFAHLEPRLEGERYRRRLDVQVSGCNIRAGPKHSVQRDGIQDETRQLMQYDDSRNVFADIGVLIPSRIPEMAVFVSRSGSSERLRCRPRRGSAERIKTTLLTGLWSSCVLPKSVLSAFDHNTHNVITGLQDSTDMSV